MIQRFEIAGVHTNVDDKLKQYVTKKIGKLDKYLPRTLRDAAHAEVKLKENKAKSNKVLYACEVTLHLPGETLQVQESTLNSYAAVDIVEEKLKHQLQKYKDQHTGVRIHRRVIRRLKNGGR